MNAKRHIESDIVAVDQVIFNSERFNEYVLKSSESNLFDRNEKLLILSPNPNLSEKVMSSHIDLTELNNVAEGDNAFVTETITLLLQEIPENLEALNRYEAEKDIVSIKALIHKMKSSFMLIGMKEIWPIVSAIEKSESPEMILDQVPGFVKICTESVDELKIMQNII